MSRATAFRQRRRRVRGGGRKRVATAAPAKPASRHRAYWLPAVLLCGGFLLDPVWTKHPVASVPTITIGRLVLAAVVASLLWELIRRRPPLRVPSLPAMLVAGGLVVGIGAIGANSALHGTLHSQGSFTGYAEFVGVVLVVLAVASAAPHFAFAILLVAAAGSLISDVLALTGLQGGSFGGTSRISGSFGNPNYLAFTTALALSVMIAAWRHVSHRVRVLIVLVMPLPLAVLALTYSRSGIIIALAGAIAAFALMRPRVRDRILVATGVTVLVAGTAVALYPLYKNLRLQSDFVGNIASGLPDKSGWDSSAEGFIAGRSSLGNPSPDVLQVTVQKATTGVSYPLGVARHDHTYLLSLSARAAGPGTRVFIGLEDNNVGAGPKIATTVLSPTWRRVNETWQPKVDSSNARFYVWTSSAGAVLYLRDVVVSASALAPAGRASARTISTRLLGQASANQLYAGRESNFIKSRTAAAKLAWKLFRQHPLFGVGWERFGVYSARELPPNIDAGSAHDEYLRMAAELGLPGVFFLLICISALALRLRRGALSRPQHVALAPLIAGAVGLVFITALETPAVTLPLAAAIGVLCASPRADTEPSAEAQDLSRSPVLLAVGEPQGAPTHPD